MYKICSLITLGIIIDDRNGDSIRVDLDWNSAHFTIALSRIKLYERLPIFESSPFGTVIGTHCLPIDCSNTSRLEFSRTSFHAMKRNRNVHLNKNVCVFL